MQKHKKITVERLEKFVSKQSWSDVNLRSMLYGKRLLLVDVTVFSVPNLERIKPSVAIANGVYVPFDRKTKRFGPSWSTHWFRVRGCVPAEWEGSEVHLLWDATCESCVYRNGTPVQGLLGGSGNDRRAEYPMTWAKPGEPFELAANGMFGVGLGGDINPVDPNKYYELLQCELAVFNHDVWDLIFDFSVISEMAKELPEQDPRAAQALFAANSIQNAVWTDDPSTVAAGRELAARFLSERAGPSAFTISATGHAHIDTAWLWPYAETRRKVARSFASQLSLMERYPFHQFSASQAQQYAWLKEDYPELYARVQAAAATGNFVPIGGTWVEMDCNLPSGESFCRQFLHGQRFFKAEFGRYCNEFWLPDTFGYSSQLPQIIRASGIRYFLTQKLSWNLINKFPHHTFMWEGLDGTGVLTHFPPADTYCSGVTVKDILYSVSNFKDQERSRDVMLLFGWGDGGGGPDAAMLERVKRCSDLHGLPRVEIRSPREFFPRMEERAAPLLKWSGELYFELHRGTYTSQALVKKGNRRGEYLLREAEAWWSSSPALLERYPSAALARLWQLLLLTQFHDVLPGSSVAPVYRDAEQHLRQVADEASALLQQALALIEENERAAQSGGADETPSKRSKTVMARRYYNSFGWTRHELLEDGTRVTVPPFSFAYPTDTKLGTGLIATALSEGRGWALENETLRAEVNHRGQLARLLYKPLMRESLKAPGNSFVIYDDVNLFWDAWDAEIFHLEKKRELSGDNTLDASVELESNSSERAVLRVSLRLSPRSRLVQRIVLVAGAVRLDFHTEVDWDENRRFLKVIDWSSFQPPFRVLKQLLRRSSVICSVQHIETRVGTGPSLKCVLTNGLIFPNLGSELHCSTIANTVMLLRSVKAEEVENSFEGTVQGGLLRLSLLRSPKCPDDTCDIGHHSFVYSLMPHADSFQAAGVIQEAYNLNVPLTASLSLSAPRPSPPSLFEVSSRAVILETLKRPENGGSAVVLRLYESWGSTAKVRISTVLNVKYVTIVNILEEPVDMDTCSVVVNKADRRNIDAVLPPFRILTLTLFLV